MRLVAHLDQLRGDADGRPGFADTSLQDVVRSQLAADLRDRLRRALYGAPTLRAITPSLVGCRRPSREMISSCSPSTNSCARRCRSGFSSGSTASIILPFAGLRAARAAPVDQYRPPAAIAATASGTWPPAPNAGDVWRAASVPMVQRSKSAATPGSVRGQQ